ncbi:MULTISPECIES: zinc-binding dehydrogenase [unclassified Sporosarcina]|uniref:zinc-binding dehydrogenase n=1 Tax=unclassified Sporosarcina TaxID=2647733 RepID=UPI000C1661E8|nr:MULTISPECIES: zinc-binding dehydrogenase [unclassified Sporosarcina]PID07194.1 alcohol dehydrogenase [Sporosarcina sp. P30]PID10390.1 alcohol dehydrogenase [Sporosarcina sp. P31]PID12975.1 alcohol dehydrogenase [Sporosarcina sp. P32b]
MKAFVHENGVLHYTDIADPSAGKGEVIVALKTAGLNRRDTAIPKRRGDAKEPLALGSDGAGTIESIGEGVTGWNVGDEVIINPALRWFEESDAPPAEFDILGMPDHGTFAEKICISSEQLEKKPSHLTWNEAAVIALAGLTGYRALVTRGRIEEGQTVFIPGAGSGVATYMIQFAKKMGARVIVSSRSEDKRKHAIKIGADVALDTNSDWPTELKDEHVDLVIESVGRATFNRSLEILKKGGRIVVFGATTEDTVELNLREFFYGQYSLLGTTMGSREELRDMLALVEEHQIHPVIDSVIPLEKANEAFTKLDDSVQFGKIVLAISN